MQQELKSKTILFNVFMSAISSANAGIAILEPVLDQSTFAISVFVIGIIHGAGGRYLRMITTKPVSDL